MRTWLLIIGSVMVLTLGRFASASEIDFALVGIVAPSEEFEIAPTEPTSDDLTAFFDPYDKQAYTNACIAATALGLPRMAINQSEHQITVSFDPFPGKCSDRALLVSGLSGNFGALSPGVWTYETPLASHSFTVVPEPAVLWIVLPLVVVLGLQRRLRGMRPGTGATTVSS